MRIVGYLSDWGYKKQLTQQQANCLTHINYAFGLVVEGEVSIAHLKRLEKLSQMRNMYPHLKVNLSIGGWGADGFSQAVKTKEGRERLAASALAVLKKMDLDGLDWDWEYPSSSAAGIASRDDDPENMSAFLVLMREKLDTYTLETGKYYEQSIAVGADRVHDYIWPKVLPCLDTVNLMTYDMTGGPMVSHATNLRTAAGCAYSTEKSVEAFMTAGVPAEKILLGAAFYFHVYQGVENEAPFGKTFKQKCRNMPADQLDDTWQRHWDAQAQAAYYTREDVLLSGDDGQSLAAKRKYAEEKGLGGIIIWEINHDGNNHLLPHLQGTESLG